VYTCLYIHELVHIRVDMAIAYSKKGFWIYCEFYMEYRPSTEGWHNQWSWDSQYTTSSYHRILKKRIFWLLYTNWVDYYLTIGLTITKFKIINPCNSQPLIASPIFLLVNLCSQLQFVCSLRAMLTGRHAAAFRLKPLAAACPHQSFGNKRREIICITKFWIFNASRIENSGKGLY